MKLGSNYQKITGLDIFDDLARMKYERENLVKLGQRMNNISPEKFKVLTVLDMSAKISIHGRFSKNCETLL